VGRKAGVRLLDVGPDHDVLEIGAGTGQNLPRITGDLDRGSLTLVDFSVTSLRVAARKANRAKANVRLIAGDASHLPIRTAFDRILFSCCLSLLPQPLQILEVAAKMLKPGGFIVVADFGRMAGWGPARSLIEWWLDRHSVVPVYECLESLVHHLN